MKGKSSLTATGSPYSRISPVFQIPESKNPVLVPPYFPKNPASPEKTPLTFAFRQGFRGPDGVN